MSPTYLVRARNDAIDPERPFTAAAVMHLVATAAVGLVDNDRLTWLQQRPTRRSRVSSSAESTKTVEFAENSRINLKGAILHRLGSRSRRGWLMPLCQAGPKI